MSNIVYNPDGKHSIGQFDLTSITEWTLSPAVLLPLISLRVGSALGMVAPGEA